MSNQSVHPINVKKALWVLGAQDPEMEAIHKLLHQHGQPVLLGIADGARCHTGNAYRLDMERYLAIAGDAFQIIWVEGGLKAGEPAGSIHVDHHKPGDYGFGAEPKMFWYASSIGQVWFALQTAGLVDEPPQELLLTAAADHCLGAAYQGRCPGVDPDELMRWRVTSKARFQNLDPRQVLERVEYAKAALLAADVVKVTLEGQEVEFRDIRQPTPVPEIPEAAARLGVNYLSGPLKSQDGRLKFTASGSPAACRAFLEVLVEREGLKDSYGDPARGFAGAYR